MRRPHLNGSVVFAFFLLQKGAEGEFRMGIVARWEWRTFGEGSFGDCEEKLRALGVDSSKKTEELYILSKNSDENIKIRFDVIDVKALQKVNEDSLEQWLPVLKTGFPIAAEQLSALFNIFNVKEPEFKRESYTYEQFLDELIRPCEELELVEVKKSREIFKPEGATAEIAETVFNGRPWRTICVEHEDPALVMKIVKELGLEGKPNINYIQAMKKSVGLSR